jgi:ribosomal protein S18 acetylase RimI-like enzyme
VPPLFLLFRDATPDDLPALEAHVQRAYRGEASRAGWTTEADLLDGQRTDREGLAQGITGGGRIRLAFLGTDLVGSFLLKPEGEAAHVGMIAVDPQRQAHGIGRALLAEAERLTAVELRLTHLRMTVIAQRSELIAWYERRGFARTGGTEPFPYGDARFGLPRQPDLYFVVLEKMLSQAEPA